VSNDVAGEGWDMEHVLELQCSVGIAAVSSWIALGLNLDGANAYGWSFAFPGIDIGDEG